jgi:3',5'-cyclic AMP phosphodiesterase CpdA
MMTRIAIPILCLATTTCCPTLWLQVTKTEPSPWPEVPVPAANAPSVPSIMPNRFDVLESGQLTRRADGYRDALDARDDRLAQQSRALTELEGLLRTYRDARLTTCTSVTSATVVCTQPDEHGLRANCNALLLDGPKPAKLEMVIVGDQARVVETVSTKTASGKPMAALAERIDAVDGQRVQACLVDNVVLSKPLLSFVHMSDIQLRDPSVVLTDRRLSKRLDWFEPLSSFEYDEDLAFYNQYVLESMVATINAAAGPKPGEDPERPSFVIHTGDSIDSGMMSELVRFHRVIDRLQIPFFELFGNHDVLVFGNLTPTDQVATANDAKCSPVAALLGSQTAWAPNKICVDVKVKPCADCSKSDVELVASPESHAATRSRFMTQLAHDSSQPVAEPAGFAGGFYCDSTQPKIANHAYSRKHGFDLGTDNDTLTGTPLGYYAFVQELAGDDRHAVFIALDSEELPDHQGGIGGHIRHAQLKWLQDVLACVHDNHPHDLVFVFAHQPLSLITVDPRDAKRDLEATLRSSDNVVGYLYGHHHRNSICGDRRVDKDNKLLTCTRFWEVQTASLVEFPQEARLVRIKAAGERLGFLEVSTFHEQLVDPDSLMARYVRLARRGAERDWCVTTEARCSTDQRVYREDGNSTSARLFFRFP